MCTISRKTTYWSHVLIFDQQISGASTLSSSAHRNTIQKSLKRRCRSAKGCSAAGEKQIMDMYLPQGGLPGTILAKTRSRVVPSVTPIKKSYSLWLTYLEASRARGVVGSKRYSSNVYTYIPLPLVGINHIRCGGKLRRLL